jgi:hypothetical protein
MDVAEWGVDCCDEFRSEDDALFGDGDFIINGEIRFGGARKEYGAGVRS